MPIFKIRGNYFTKKHRGRDVMYEELNEISEIMLEEIGNTFRSLNNPSFKIWFGGFALASLTEDRAVFSTPSNLRQKFLATKYKDMIKDALKAAIGFEVSEIEIISTEESDAFEDKSQYRVPERTEEEKIEADQREKEINKFLQKADGEEGGVLSEYTFDNFIEGESNKFAKAACFAVANEPCVYNPLFIHGHSGLGKTHLLYAVTNEIKRRNPGAKIIYKTGEDFTNELISSITSGSTTKFRDRYRNADVLLIDDIQFIAGRESTQEEFFHTFNALHSAHKQIILTSDRPPKAIKTLEDRLRTRFEWGLIADIQPPSLELRTAIILKKAEFYELDLDPEIVEYLSQKLQDNVRQIEGAIKKIAAISILTGTPVTLDMCKRSIADFLSEEVPLSVTLDRIFDAVSKKYNVSVEEIKGKRRNDNIANARHVCIYLIRNMTEMSLSAIGELFSRDHTTVISSIKKVEKDINIYKNMDEDIRALMNEINS